MLTLYTSFWNFATKISLFCVGCSGYMSPEYAIDGLFSFKSDVFSFGVILLEMLSGKKNRLFFHPDHKLNLLGHVSKINMILSKLLKIIFTLQGNFIFVL